MSYERGNFRDKWRIERLARDIRASLGLDRFAVLELDHLCEAVPAQVFEPIDLVDVVAARRFEALPWDAFSFSFPGESTLLIVINAARPMSRRTASILEEVAHHLLGHVPSAISIDRETGLHQRVFNRSQEDEAFDLGTAMLLPKERIQLAVGRRELAEEVATLHHCSVELVEYRIKRLRLWSRYSGYAA